MSGGAIREPSDARFERHRDRILGLAYRMTGSLAEAEDIVQEAWLRWVDADRSEVADEEAFLIRVVTRLCLDHLKSARVKRETYWGPWLPEPVLDAETMSAQSRLELSEDVGFALMLALDRLTPSERIAFILHDVFDIPYDEVSRCLRKSPEACRQLASRARRTLRSASSSLGDPRGVDPTRHRELVGAFIAAAADGDHERLVEYLTAEAMAVSDGGGKVAAAGRPLHGADHIARFLIGVLGKQVATGAYLRFLPAPINGMPGLLTFDGDELIQAAQLEFASDGRLDRLYLIRNPDKLDGIRDQAARLLKEGQDVVAVGVAP